MIENPHQPTNNTVTNNNTVNLHPEILTILFENRRYIKSIFLELNGLYNLNHFGLTIIDSTGGTLAFSTTPSIEYNLINQDLWNNDCCFMLPKILDNSLIWWDEIENETIKKIKLFNNKFTLGMTLAQEKQGFIYLYSYATQHKTINLKDYYISNKAGITNLGNYFFKSVQNLYASYASSFSLHKSEGTISKSANGSNKPDLKLIVNNL